MNLRSLSSSRSSAGRPRAAVPLLVLLSLLPLLAGRAQALQSERSERMIGPGVRLLSWSVLTGPNTLYAVEVDASQKLIQLGVSVGKGGTLGLDPLSRQAERLTRPDRYPIAGVNGDFFYYPNPQQPGIPTNAVVVDGELVRTPYNRSCLVLDAEGRPSIRLLRARGRFVRPDGAERLLDNLNHPRGANQLVLYTPWYGSTTRTGADGTEVYLEPEQFPFRPGTSHKAKVRAVQDRVGAGAIQPGAWVLSGSGPAADFLKGLAPGDNVELRFDFDPALNPGDQVLGGGPRLVRDGRVSVEAEGGSINGSFATARHPRTAIGFAGQKLYLLVVDGRQPGYSAGMSLAELGQAMLDLGCTDAINMDGGGSTTLWVRGALANRPSDGRERPVANGLLVFSTAPKGDPVRLVPSPTSVAALAGAELPLAVTAEDEYFNPITLGPERLRWSVEPEVGTVTGGRFSAKADVSVPAGQDYLAGNIRVTAGDVQGFIPVRVHARPSRLEIRPGVARLGTSSRVAFTVSAYDSAGRPLALPGSVTWDCSQEVGAIDASGTLTTHDNDGRGEVNVTVNGVTASALVEVTQGVAGAGLLDNFETPGDWKASTAPSGTPGAVSVAPGTARSGKNALRLEYDFSGGAGTRAVYATTSKVLGRPLALRMWAYGDGQGTWLRLRLRDANKMAHMLDVARRVDWKGTWKELRVPISEDIPGPITLEALYVVEPDATRTHKGAILIDDLTVEQ